MTIAKSAPQRKKTSSLDNKGFEGCLFLVADCQSMKIRRIVVWYPKFWCSSSRWRILLPNFGPVKLPISERSTG